MSCPDSEQAFQKWTVPVDPPAQFRLELPGIGAAFKNGMSILIIATGFTVTGLIVGLFATATAPVGYEDETGFHFGNEAGQTLMPRKQVSAHPLGSASFTPKPA